MQTAMFENRDTKILRNRLLAATLVILAFLVLLAHARQLYFGASGAEVSCCEPAPDQAGAPQPQTGHTDSFDLNTPYQLTPQELSQVGRIPPDEWTLGAGSHRPSH